VVSELQYLVSELHAFIANRASQKQIADLCGIIIEQSRTSDLRILRGASSIRKRIEGRSSLPFDYAYAEREVQAMRRHFKR